MDSFANFPSPLGRGRGAEFSQAAVLSFANLRAYSTCSGATGPATLCIHGNILESFLKRTGYWLGL